VASTIGLKHFRADGCLSYFLFDRQSRESALIDPTFELIDDYRAFLAEESLKLVSVLDTHTHADHFSASHLFLNQYGCEVGMSHLSQSLRPTRKLKHGDLISIGQVQLKVLETSGHTPDSICFVAPEFVFTGDTLFIGSSGRTDFPGADPGQQWDSLHQILGKLPPNLLVFPGHDYNDLLFSTIGTEYKKNPHVLIPSREEFIAMKNSELIPHEREEIRRRVQFNLQKAPSDELSGLGGAASATSCGVATMQGDRVASISVEKYLHKLKEQATGNVFLDVREPNEYSEGHIPGTVNLPLSELGLAIQKISQAKRIYISCLSGRRSSMAVKTLTYLGLPDVVNVTGGYKAWMQTGYSIEK